MKYKKLKYLLLFIYLISPSISYSIDLPDINNLIIHKEKKKIGKVEFFNTNNKKVSLKNFNSHLKIINFWATWCAPCKEEMPHLDKLVSKKKFKNINVIPINIEDENLQKSKEFFKELNINNLQIFYGSGLDLSKQFKLRGIPTTIFIDKNGYEFARAIGYIDFDNKSIIDWLYNHL
tara:strand:- start:101 stop:631 length:531 start_codon:yes stop_codon:yes gene_type:complete